MDRRLATLAPSVATATLALMTAAWAATGDGRLAVGERAEPLALAAAATGPLVADDHDGVAILTAPAMAPGSTATGEVTISNAGDAPGAFSLAASAPADSGGPAGGLSAIVALRVSDVSGSTPVTVYAGTLTAFRGAALGTLDAGAARRYRFEVTYPAGRTAAMDDPYQGASTSLALSWTATAVAGAPAPAPTPTPTPTPSAPASPAPAAPPAPSAPAAPAAPAPAAGSPATTAPAPSAPAAPALTVTLGTAAKPVSRGRLVTWLQSTATATARVTGTVSFSGHSAKLPATTVKLTAGKRATVRLRLPSAAAAPKRRLTVRLSVTATAGAQKATVKRTLRATAS